MSNVGEASGARRPTQGYLYTIAAAAVGLPCIGTGVGGALIGRAGGDPIDALDSYTVATFLFMFALLFGMRLIFQASAPAGLRHAMRLFISATFALCIPASLLAIGLSLSLAKNAAVPVVFSMFAIVCQIGSIVWLLSYRQEGY